MVRPPSTTKRAIRRPLPAVAGAFSSILLLALAVILSACAPPTEPALTTCPTPRGPAVERIPWKVGVVIPDGLGADRLAQSQALMVALVCDLQPDDSLIAVRENTFEVIVSAVVPGDRHLLAKAKECREVPVGGPSPECLVVAAAQRSLGEWREHVAETVAAIRLTNLQSATGCASHSGWPREAITQLLLSLQPDHTGDSYSWLLVAGDADALSGGQPLTDLVRDIHVVVAPYVLACGNLANLTAWFGGARAIDLYPAESPALRFPAFLRDRAHLAGVAS